jgi:hypothetical protein
MTHHDTNTPQVSALVNVVASILLCLAYVLPSEAQTARNAADTARSSRGKEFVLAFLPNVHELRANGTPAFNDSLFIFITCDKPTRGTVTFRNRAGMETTRGFQITNPDQFAILSVTYQGFELEGFNVGERSNPNAQNEALALQSFFVRAEDDVTVYGLNQAHFTSDAFLALPVRALGKEYLVMSYNSDGQGLAFNPAAPGRSTPSQFAVVATENDTEVRILPSAPTFRSPTGEARTVRMRRGDVYLVQADVRQQQGIIDLTGSRIIANKPVAVFGSHQRATLPIRLRDQLNSRDHIVEQLPGLETWGKSAFVTPYAPPRTQIALGTDLLRVLAAFDNTRVFLNGTQVAQLNAGQFYEAGLLQAGWITASDQVLVAQYKKTSNQANVNTISMTGDPFMMIIPTVEQWDNSYRFINVQADERDSANRNTRLVFEQHFITIVIHPNGLATLEVDGRRVPPSAFQPVSNSGYVFANIELPAGVHTARSDSAFGLYVYGYGLANSYGYIGGGKLRIIAPDRDRPVIAAQTRCFEVTGVVYDTLETDSRLRLVAEEPVTTGTVRGNVRVEIEPFTPFVDSVSFRAALVNIFQDGAFSLRAQDSIGFITRRTFPIFGFTVGLEGQNATVLPPTRDFSITTGQSRAFPLTIVNYGTTTQTVSRLNFARAGTGLDAGTGAGTPPSGFFLQDSVPIVLRPGERRIVNVRFNATRDGIFTDTLQLISTCATRSVAVLRVTAGSDTTPPEIRQAPNYCALRVDIRVNDSTTSFASGVALVEPLQLVNCTVRFDSLVNSGNVLTGVITIINPRLDALYSLRVRDSSGNVSTIADTLQGFTLRLLTSRDSIERFGERIITDVSCRTFTYANVGLKPFEFSILAPQQNQYFSMPIGQFPITIAPNERKTFTLCFAPLQSREYRDTLMVLQQRCFGDSLLLRGTGLAVEASQLTRCSVAVRTVLSSAPQQYFMQQNTPNPATGSTTITLGMAQAGQATLTLYNALGARVETLLQRWLEAGTTELSIDVSRLETGVYFYELQTSSGRIVKQLTVVR